MARCCSPSKRTPVGTVPSELEWSALGYASTFDESLTPADTEYDAADKLLEYGTKEYTWNAVGQLSSVHDTATNETASYEYDLFGNLLSVSLPDGRSIEYDVDGAGRRVGRRVLSSTGVELEYRGWIYRDLLRPIAEVDALGNVVARYVYADGDGAKQNGVSQLSTRLGANQDTSLPFAGDNVPEIIELLSGGVVTQRLRLIKDQVGTVELVTDASTGEVVQRLEHDEFGRVLFDSDPGLQPFGFAGGLYDAETGLVRFGARDYDPSIGRWTARDPVRNKSGVNGYMFASGAPTVAADATGLKPYQPSKWDIFGAICDVVTLGNCPIPTRLDDVIWDPFEWDQYKKSNDIVVTCLQIRAAGFRCCQDSAWSTPYACGVDQCDPQSQSCDHQCE